MENTTPTLAQKVKAYLNKKSFWVILLVILALGYYIYNSKKSTSSQVQYQTGQVTKGTLSVSVSGTGQVAAENQLDVKPSGSAKIVAVYVKQGQQVKTGDRIVMLDQTSASNSITQAKASLQSAKANYDSVVAGSTDTDLKLAQSSVDSAQLALDKAKSDYTLTQAAQDQAVSKAYLAFLNDDLEAYPAVGNLTSATVSVSGNYQGTEQGSYVLTTYQTGNGVFYRVSGFSDSSTGPVLAGQLTPLGSKGLYFTFSTTGSIYSDSSWTIDLPNNRSSNYLTLNNAYQSAILTRQQTMQNAQNTINSAQIALNNAQTQLKQKQQGSTNAQIESAAAQVANAEANLQTAYTNYQNNIITAPFDGVIAQLSAKIGDQVSGNTAAAGSTNLATLITKQKIVSIALNEVDVSKIKLGEKATVTFDAIDNLNMTGTVTEIDSIGTVSQGVVTYNVKISLDTDDEQIKPGMSASVNIITEVKTDVLMVPNSAVKSSANGSYVQALDKSGKPYNINVQAGISNDTDTEITQGLSEGQEIVTQTLTTSSASTGATTSGSRNAGFGTFGAGGGNVRIITR